MKQLPYKWLDRSESNIADLKVFRLGVFWTLVGSEFQQPTERYKKEDSSLEVQCRGAIINGTTERRELGGVWQ